MLGLISTGISTTSTPTISSGTWTDTSENKTGYISIETDCTITSSISVPIHVKEGTTLTIGLATGETEITLGDVVNNGTIEVSSCSLAITGAVSGDGEWNIGISNIGNSTLSMSGRDKTCSFGTINMGYGTLESGNTTTLTITTINLGDYRSSLSMNNADTPAEITTINTVGETQSGSAYTLIGYMNIDTINLIGNGEVDYGFGVGGDSVISV